MLQLGRRVRIDGYHLLIEIRPGGGLGHLGFEEGPRAHLDIHYVGIVETEQQILQLDECIAFVLDLPVISTRSDDDTLSFPRYVWSTLFITYVTLIKDKSESFRHTSVCNPATLSPCLGSHKRCALYFRRRLSFFSRQCQDRRARNHPDGPTIETRTLIGSSAAHRSPAPSDPEHSAISQKIVLSQFSMENECE